jgi:hypothetical protein
VTPREDLLHGCWVYSYEEDRDEEMVFRRPTYPFPMARGRRAIELRPDGTYVESFPGPVDVPEQAKGRWRLEDDRVLLRPDEDGAERSWRITSREADRLTVRAESGG